MNYSEPIDYERMLQQVHAHPYRLVFTTIIGAHVYGFPSPDSDFDLRGALCSHCERSWDPMSMMKRLRRRT